MSKWLQELLVWNSIIRLLIESSLDLLISALIRLRKVRILYLDSHIIKGNDLGTGKELIDSVFAIIVLAVLG
jgi:hypothetical protein